MDGDYSKYKWLDSDDPSCNSAEYFKQISYYVDLSDLYKVLGTCYYNDEMPYCPIFLEITEPKIQRKFNDCSYLIQIWNKNHEKIFEIPLKFKLRNWNICYRYLVYSIEDDDHIYVQDLEENFKSVKVRGYGLESSVNFFSYNNGYLFALKDYEINILQITQAFSKEGTIVEASQSKIRTIPTTLKISGCPMSTYQFKDKYSMIVFETADNQLEFDKILFSDFAEDDKFSYRYEQIREATPREVKKDDPVIKNQFTYANGFMFAVSLRKSGAVDLYWNMSRKESVEDGNNIHFLFPIVNIKDVAMSIGAYYFQLQDDSIVGFEHKNLSTFVSFSKALPIPSDEINFQRIYMKRLQNIVKLYTGFHIVKIREVTMAVITHGCFVSIYEINKKVWLNHVQFEDEIVLLFRHYKTKGDRYQTILCKNGAVYIGILDYDDAKEPVADSKRNFKIEGQILRWGEDIENNQTLYLICNEGGKKVLKVIFRGKCQTLNEVTDMKDNLNVVCFQARGEVSSVLIQNGTEYTLYNQKIADDKLNLEKVKVFPKFDMIKGLIHSGCAYDINSNFFLFDENNMYVVKNNNTGASSCITYEDINCVGIQTISKNFNYALCQETSKSRNPGLRFFDMEQIINRNKGQMTLLKRINVGTLGYFEKGTTVMRFGFMDSLDFLIITPILHRNMNRFMGSANLADYLTFNVIKDKMMALKNTGEIQTWNLYTGKLEESFKATNIEWSKYDLHNKTKRGRVFLKSKEEIKDQKFEDHFFQWQLTPSIEKQKTFQQTTLFKFRRWYYIELLGPQEVKIHMEFIHPSYEFQRMFVNDKIDRMISILINYRTYFFQIDRPDSENPHLISLKLLRQINDYPSDLDNDTKYLEHFSPCLQRYMYYDKKEGQMVIKGTYNGQELYKIPKKIMNMQKNDPNPKYFTNRMLWRTTNQMQVVNEDGVESLVDIDEDFKELGSNVRPLFNDIDGVEWLKWHYFRERATFDYDEITKRLKCLYQNYKTEYYLNPIKNIMRLRRVMFNVDNWYFHHNEMSFSFVHWSLMEQIKAGKLNIGDLEIDLVETLIYNIVPGGQTLLHYLAEQKDQIQTFFEMTHSSQNIKIHVPFLANFSGVSMIHQLAEKKDFKAINTVLGYLKLYDIDHHSKAIKNVYPLLLQEQLPNLLDYLDSRFKQTNELKKIDRGSLQDENKDQIVSSLKFERCEIEREIFIEEVASVSQVKLQFLDIPGFYHYLDDEFANLFQQLAQTDRFEYFSNRAIQELIDFNYPLVQQYITYRIVVPFSIFHLLFVFYMNLIFEYINDNDFCYWANWILSPILFIFATYFLVNEYKQLKQGALDYITSVWNYIDIIAPLGVYAMICMLITQFLDYEINQDAMRIILSISTFFMWLKLLYIMRIFKKTGYLIRMIIDVIADMGVFLLLLLITVLAFGDSLLRISLGNEQGEAQFAGTNFIMSILYAYRMILGDFATDNFGEVAVPMVWLLFLFATIFDLIVMLNLLIAIISDSYARISSASEQAGYQEQAKLIDENQYLIPIDVRMNYAKKNQYMIVVTNLDKEQEESSDPIIEKLKDLEKTIEAMSDKFADFKTGFKQLQEGTADIASIKTMQSELQSKQSNIQSALDELKKRPAASQSIMTQLHNHSLDQHTLTTLIQVSGAYSGGFGCDGRKFTGCKSGIQANSADFKTDETETIWHCFKCNFDYCEKCFDSYGKNAHPHKLTKVTFASLQKFNNYSKGWLCDARLYSGCPNGEKTHTNKDAVVYHDNICNFDLCGDCASTYRA